MPAKRKTLFYSLLAMFILAVVLFVYRFRVRIGNIILPFVMAGIIAYILSPLVHRLERRNIPVRTGILLVYLCFAVFIVLTSAFILPEAINNVRDLTETLPELTEQYQNLIRKSTIIIQSSKWPDEVKEAVFDQINTGTGIARDYVARILGKSLDVMIAAVQVSFDFVLAMIIAYYFIKDSEFFREAFLSLVPRRWRNWIVGTGREINGVLSKFIQGQLLTALIVGTLEIIGLLLTGVKYPLILGIFGGMANVIPYFGPVIGAVPAVGVALIQSPVKALWVILVFVTVQQIDNILITPKVVEGKLGLHPVSTILAVLIGQEFYGIPGMLIAVPVMAIMKILLKRLIDALV